MCSVRTPGLSHFTRPAWKLVSSHSSRFYLNILLCRACVVSCGVFSETDLTLYMTSYSRRTTCKSDTLALHSRAIFGFDSSRPALLLQLACACSALAGTLLTSLISLVHTARRDRARVELGYRYWTNQYCIDRSVVVDTSTSELTVQERVH